MEVAEEKTSVEKLIGHVKSYAETRFDLLLIDAQDKFTSGLSSVVSIFIIGMLIFFGSLFLSVAVAWWIGVYFHSPSIGFFCIAGFYLLAALILYFNREKWIKLPLINSLLKKINIHEED